MASELDMLLAEVSLASLENPPSPSAPNLSSPRPAPLNIGERSMGEEERLIVRVDQPIENVEFAAHTLLRGVDGGVLTPTSRKIRFKWLRSKNARGCSYRECPTPRKNACLESLLTGRRYCSKLCLHADWKLSDAGMRRVLSSMLDPLQSQYKDIRDDDKSNCWRVRPFAEDDIWEVVGQQKSYVPTSDDVGHVLKVQCSAIGIDGQIGVTQEKETPVVIGVESSHDRLLRRSFWLAPHVRRKTNIANFLKSGGGGAVIRVMSYNVLAEVYASKQLFPYCPLWALSWGYRRQLIFKELERHQADVLCLQEMQQDHYDTYIKPALSALGYEGVYKSKTRESMGRKGKIDGVAILYKRSRLRLIDTQEIEYNTIAIGEAKIGHYALAGLSPAENERRTDLILKRLCKDNVGLITMMETIPEGFSDSPTLAAAARQTGPQQFCIATTHMYWDPEFADVKYIQTYHLLQELSQLVGNEMPLILTGDFNSTPDSAVVEYLGQDSVNPDHPDFSTDPFHLLEDISMSNHNLQLASAYNLVTGSEPHSTNYTAHFSGVLDYVWVSTNSLTPLSVLAIPDEKTLRGEDDTFMPNCSFPSDHISLCVDININPRDRVQSRPTTPSPPSPSLTPPMTPDYEHLQQMHYYTQHQQIGQHSAQQRVQSQSTKTMHSPNPAMLGGAYHLQQQLEGRSHSPAMHPLSQQQQAAIQQQQFLQQSRLY